MARRALMVMGDASTVTLPDILVDVLRAHRKSALELRMQLGAGRLPDDALLFSTINGGPLSPTVVSTAWGEFAGPHRHARGDIPLEQRGAVHSIRHSLSPRHGERPAMDCQSLLQCFSRRTRHCARGTAAMMSRGCARTLPTANAA